MLSNKLKENEKITMCISRDIYDKCDKCEDCRDKDCWIPFPDHEYLKET